MYPLTAYPTTTNYRIVFLPGASGDPSFWHGVGECLPSNWEKRFLAWPGLGNQAPAPGIDGFADLIDLASSALTAPSIIMAQSMGGIIAVQLALRHPELVTHLILVATSGGLDVTALGAMDWRQDFLRSYPNTACWILEDNIDLTARLHEINTPTLLLWGDADPISPPAVGQSLNAFIRSSQLTIIPDADHGMGTKMPGIVASHVRDFITPPAYCLVQTTQHIQETIPPQDP